jgi:large subunit ribosomal protein L4
MEGKEVGSLPLPDAIFGVTYNEALVHQAIVAEEANQRQGTHNTKRRHEVRGGGRKPWRQKGTGRARAGTSRSPLWRGGGVVFGPHPRDYRKALPLKMRRGAMRSVLSGKVSEGAVIGLEALSFGDKPSTKSAAALLKALTLNDTRRVLIVIPDYDATVLKSTRNIQGVELRFAPNFSVRDALNAHKIVLVKDAIARIESVWTPGDAEEAEAEAPAEAVEKPKPRARKANEKPAVAESTAAASEATADTGDKPAKVSKKPAEASEPAPEAPAEPIAEVTT